MFNDNNPPAGWYPDPQNPSGPQKYWDGASWVTPARLNAQPAPSTVSGTIPNSTSSKAREDDIENLYDHVYSLQRQVSKAKTTSIMSTSLAVAAICVAFFAPGLTGQQGPVGPQGPQGIQGEPGPAGMDGIDGSNGMNGSSGVSGQTGGKCSQWDRVDVVTKVRLQFIGDTPYFTYDTVKVCEASLW